MRLFSIFGLFALFVHTLVAQQTQTEWQQEAVKRYPDLGRSGSALNSLFVSRHNELRKSDPSFFDDPKWPLTLARRCLAETSASGTLPGSTGPLFEYVGKSDARVLAADVHPTVPQLEPIKPGAAVPKGRALPPSDGKEIYIGILFDKEPKAKKISLNIYNNIGRVEIESGVNTLRKMPRQVATQFI